MWLWGKACARACDCRMRDIWMYVDRNDPCLSCVCVCAEAVCVLVCVCLCLRSAQIRRESRVCVRVEWA